MGHVAGSELGPGTEVAGYRVEALIGRGGMGAIYRAEEVGLGRKVALKVIAPELASEELFRERFLRESKIAASLEHPHVVPIHGAGEDEDVLFLAMRYVEGTDLAKLLAAEGPLEPDRALSLLSQVAEALDAAHARGLIHRDVKPSNVLIAEAAGSESCYLADFGLTKRTDSESAVSTPAAIVGTLEYIAPEQITGGPLDARADVYSLGCVLYECLTGQVPFPRATDVALLWAHVNEEPPPPSSVRAELPAELDAVLARALAKDPRERFASAGELLEACSEPDAIVVPTARRGSQTNLPRPLSSFVGRELELAEVRVLIEDGARLLTLTGPGGTGKTRLAVEAARSLVDQYQGDVFWVGLASLRDPTLVTATIAESLGARDGLAELIGERKMLILLDNLEQVIDSAPDLSSLLEHCPNLTLLVTSRELLRVQGEVEYTVPPLAEHEAVSLFCERSRLGPSEEIAELCARLDNLPLAVELAAARTKAMSPAQILEHLSEQLELFKGRRDADPRQQTLRATIEWSYDLLSEEEQRLFRRLSVFAGGCTLEAAEEICDADLDTLQSLVEKSLLRFTKERYWMLETIREYAGQQLDKVEESERLRRRHTDFFATLAREVSTESRGSSREGGDRLEDERDNLRSALSHAFARADIELAYELATAYGLLCIYRGPQTEGRAWLDAALRVADGVAPLLRERALGVAAHLAQRQDDLEAGRVLAEDRLELARARGDPDAIGAALGALGVIECYAGNLNRGEELQREAVAAFTASANDVELSHALGMLGFTLFARGAYPEAKAVCQEAMSLARAAGDRRGVGIAASHLGDVLAHEGRFDEALRLQGEALQVAQELHDVQATGAMLLDIAVLATSLREYESAGEMLGAAGGLAESREFALLSFQVDSFDETLEVLRRQLGEDELDRITARGRRMPLDELVRGVVEFIDARS